ncbi:MAG TPA: metallophosphoesterase [Prosthecobacter sp.]|nr:metallophosphoesterase [Prosthecobacter sp.]
MTLAAVGGTTGGTALAGSGSAGRRNLKLERVEIILPNLPPALDGFRIGQLSDLHLEPFTTEADIQKAVEMCNGLNPDLITLTGDFVTDTAEAAPTIAELLGQLRAPQGVFACLGNHDYWSGAAQVVKALKEQKIPVLCEETRRIRTDRGSLYLGATDSNYMQEPNVRKTLAEFKEKQPLVLMMHEPDGADVVAAAGVQALQLSGHTHGGQLRFLGKDPMNMRRARWGKKYLEGHYNLGSVQLYVNRGIGCVGVPWRIGCPPEVTEITLRAPKAA